MKHKIYILLILIFTLTSTSSSQIIFNNKVDSIKNLVLTSSIMTFNKELSGAIPVVVGGNTYSIYSRKYNSPMNPVAAQYIYEKLQSYGLSTRYQYNSSTNINVLGKKTGTKYPNKYYIVCAHYDDFNNFQNDTIPGSDDNASGICTVLESARLLANMPMDYTVYFIAFDEEERGLYGSEAFVDSAYARGDSIMGVINLDMISYNTTPDSKIFTVINTLSVELADDFINVNQVYNIGLFPSKATTGGALSDYYYFWEKGYKALWLSEYSSNPYYHTGNDTYDKIDQTYFTKAVKASLATLLSWTMGLKAILNHNAILSSSDTSARVALLKYSVPFRVAQGQNAPRLYYKVNNSSYQYVNSFYSSSDTLKFRIPGQLPATKITYYFAMQDSLNTAAVTLPIGGSGVNPPGNVPPSAAFSYYIYSGGNQCSNIQKPIPDLVILQDTVSVNISGKVSNIKVNLNINHPNDGELTLMLRSPEGVQITLSQNNGTGGANYTNTTFDDSASVSITNGVPPFTGSYKPQVSFNSILNTNLNGNWILRLFDNTAGNQGTLLNWCILFKYYVPISVNENTTPVSFELKQNYPNPFNPVTRIGFSIAKKDFVTLKIFDQLGREIQTLINDVLTPGDYEAVWNAKNYPSGAYYYRIETNGLSETKRMLLTK
jgi:aminopeptidase YwaD